MRVYVVEYVDWDESEVKGVYATRELAKASIRDHESNHEITEAELVGGRMTQVLPAGDDTSRESPPPSRESNEV